MAVGYWWTQAVFSAAYGRTRLGRLPFQQQDGEDESVGCYSYTNSAGRLSEESKASPNVSDVD